MSFGEKLSNIFFNAMRGVNAYVGRKRLSKAKKKIEAMDMPVYIDVHHPDRTSFLNFQQDHQSDKHGAYSLAGIIFGSNNMIADAANSLEEGAVLKQFMSDVKASDVVEVMKKEYGDIAEGDKSLAHFIGHSAYHLLREGKSFVNIVDYTNVVRRGRLNDLVHTRYHELTHAVQFSQIPALHANAVNSFNMSKEGPKIILSPRAQLHLTRLIEIDAEMKAAYFNRLSTIHYAAVSGQELQGRFKTEDELFDAIIAMVNEHYLKGDAGVGLFEAGRQDMLQKLITAQTPRADVYFVELTEDDIRAIGASGTNGLYNSFTKDGTPDGELREEVLTLPNYDEQLSDSTCTVFSSNDILSIKEALALHGMSAQEFLDQSRGVVARPHIQPLKTAVTLPAQDISDTSIEYRQAVTYTHKKGGQQTATP